MVNKGENYGINNQMLCIGDYVRVLEKEHYYEEGFITGFDGFYYICINEEYKVLRGEIEILIKNNEANIA